MSSTGQGPLRPSARVGAFVVREEIGFGAMSIVYEAEHRTTRQRVAVKVLRSNAEIDRELRARFEREMRLSAALRSPHVAQVYDVGELPSGVPYIVMERLSGSPLSEWLSKHRRLPLDVVVEVGIQICSALNALHELGYLHRDVKPENLVLHRERDTYTLKLVDFGICKPEIEDGPALTARGTVVGTPEYMSPEQVQGLDVDVRTDVYSTGVVLYELVAGCTPFPGRKLESVGRAILVAEPPSLNELRPECGARLEGIVMRAMARDRHDRHPSVDRLRRELDRFADEHGLRRNPRVWSLLPGKSPLERAPQSKTGPEPPRESADTLVTTRIPVQKGIFATAAGGLCVLAVAFGTFGYYAFQERIADALIARQRSAAPHVEAPLSAVTRPPLAADTDSMSRAELTASELDHPMPIVSAPEPQTMPAVEPRPVRRRARRAQPPETTIALAPLSTPTPTPTPEPLPPPPTTISAAELLETARGETAPPEPPFVAENPYDNAPPRNPF